MIELHLIGYTEDAEDLVLDLDADGEGRYTVRVDPDLLATVAQLRELRVARGAPVDRRPEPPAPAPAVAATVIAGSRASAPVPPTNGSSPQAASPSQQRRVPATPRGPATPVADEPPAAGTPDDRSDDGRSDDGRSDDGRSDDRAGDDRAEHRPAALAVPHAKLSPAAIQAQLRAGRSVRAVAQEAGTDRAWIERWLPPIVAERERVLEEARRRRLDVPRARPLGTSVDRALTERGVAPDRRSWSATRRADGRWRVSVRFEDRGRPRTATWLMDPAGERLQAASALAEELAGPGSRSPRRR